MENLSRVFQKQQQQKKKKKHIYIRISEPNLVVVVSNPTQVNFQ